MSKIHNENNRSFFPIAGLQQLMVRHVRHKMVRHEYCSAKHEWQLKNVIIRYYQKPSQLPQVSLLLFLQRYVQPQDICTEHEGRFLFAIFNPTWSHIPKKTQIRDSLNSILVKKDRNYVITNFMTLRMTN